MSEAPKEPASLGAGDPHPPRRKRPARKKAAVSTAPTNAPAPAARTERPSAPVDSPKPRPAEPSAPASATLVEALARQDVESLGQLSRNLGEVMTRANQVFANALIDQTRSPLPLRADPFDVAGAMGAVWTKLAEQPETIREAHGALWRTYLDIWNRYSAAALTGEPALNTDADPRDKRFRDPEWRTNPNFALLRETYLATANFVTGLIEKANDVDEPTRRKALFFTKQAMDAASPSNFLATNPTALRALFETRGESLVRGMENLAEDLKRGHGSLAIKQTDLAAFQLGVNIATAPGKVVFRNEVFELIHYAPSTQQTFEIPLLIFPPWINKFYILDLQPKNSMIRWLTDQGFPVFLVSWVNPEESETSKTFEDYMRDGVYAAVEATLKASGAERVNTVGYCIGGTLLATTLCHMAKRGDQRIASATYFASQCDFDLAGDLTVFTDDAAIKYLEDRIESQGGVLDAQAMADTFNALRSNDLVWNYVVDNYYLGQAPTPFDLLYWNADQTRMPRALHLFYLKRFYNENALARGQLSLLGEQLSLRDVKTPSYFQAAKEDHISPFPSVYRSARHMGGEVTFMLAGSGHIAGVINPPAAHRYQHWTNDALPSSVEEWRRDAVEHEGSWWPHWRDWLAPRSGAMIPARTPGEGALPALADAPGEYVKVRSDT